MIIILSALAAIIPMSLYLYFIWKYDKYDREPIKLVLASYLWGAIGAVFLAFIGSFALNFIVNFFIDDEFGVNFIGAVFVAPFVEEITKGLFLLIIITNKRFDNLTDGIVYGGAIGLGFGMTENFLYFINNSGNFSEWFNLVVVRSLFSGVMHLVSTATLGAFLGLSKFMYLPLKITLGLVGLFLAMLIHALWNFLVSFEITVFLGFIFLILLVIIFFGVFKFSLNRERKMIFKELYEESINGLIPSSHLHILSSTQRDKTGWIDEKIRIPYIKCATTLAFRKRQSKLSKGYSKIFYLEEVNYYRNQIINLLSQASFTI